MGRTTQMEGATVTVTPDPPILHPSPKNIRLSTYNLSSWSPIEAIMEEEGGDYTRRHGVVHPRCDVAPCDFKRTFSAPSLRVGAAIVNGDRKGQTVQIIPLSSISHLRTSPFPSVISPHGVRSKRSWRMEGDDTRRHGVVLPK